MDIFICNIIIMNERTSTPYSVNGLTDPIPLVFGSILSLSYIGSLILFFSTSFQSVGANSRYLLSFN